MVEMYRPSVLPQGSLCPASSALLVRAVRPLAASEPLAVAAVAVLGRQGWCIAAVQGKGRLSVMAKAASATRVPSPRQPNPAVEPTAFGGDSLSTSGGIRG